MDRKALHPCKWFGLLTPLSVFVAMTLGTTSLRALESEAQTQQASGETNLFITPGYTFKTVDCLLTNFHLPK